MGGGEGWGSGGGRVGVGWGENIGGGKGCMRTRPVHLMIKLSYTDISLFQCRQLTD